MYKLPSVVLGGMLLGGCVTSPYDSFTLERRTDPVEFVGFSNAPGARVSLQARNFISVGYEEFASAISADQPDIDARAFRDNPALYSWRVTAPIARSLAEADARFSRCRGDTEDLGDETASISQPLCALSHAEIIVSDPERSYWTFGKGGVDCVNQRISNGDGLVNASYVCAPFGDAPLRIQSRF